MAEHYESDATLLAAAAAARSSSTTAWRGRTAGAVEQWLRVRSSGPAAHAVSPARPPGAPQLSGETIEATGGRPFWVKSGQDLDKRPVSEQYAAEVPNAATPGRWVNVIDRRVGDILFTRDGHRVPETNVSVRLAEMKVYNLQVAELENHTVGHSDTRA